MNALSTVFCWFVVGLHFWFYVLESFLWNKPLGLKLMHMKKEQADATWSLAFNQGFYNLFFSAFLFAAIWRSEIYWIYFFLASIIFLGFLGGLSTKKYVIIGVQALPAIAAIICLYMGW